VLLIDEVGRAVNHTLSLSERVFVDWLLHGINHFSSFILFLASIPIAYLRVPLPMVLVESNNPTPTEEQKKTGSYHNKIKITK